MPTTYRDATPCSEREEEDEPRKPRTTRTKTSRGGPLRHAPCLIVPKQEPACLLSRSCLLFVSFVVFVVQPLPLQGNSTSAGATTRSSCPAGGAGSRYAVTRQPWCFSTPANGGWPVTLPVSRTADGSKPAGTVAGPSSSPGSTGSSVRCSWITACDF